MREYGKVATRTWRDARVLQLNGSQKLVWFYLLAGSQTNCLGCFRCTRYHLAADDVCAAKEGEAALARLEAIGLIERDTSAELVRLPRWFRYNRLTNEKHGTGALMELLALPASPLLARVVEDLHDFAAYLPAGWETRVAHLVPNEHAKAFGKDFGKESRDLSPSPIPSHPNPSHMLGGSPAPAGSPSNGIAIPLKDGTSFTPTVEQVRKWGAAYPELDVTGELRRAAEWCEASPKKRKTRSRAPAFCISWLNRARAYGKPPRTPAPLPNLAEVLDNA